MTTPFGQEPAVVWLTAHDGGAMYPDDEGQWVSLHFDDDEWTMVFSEAEPYGDETALVQRSYHISRFPQTRETPAWDGYGGVESASLRSGVLQLVFSAGAAAELGFRYRDVRIALELQPFALDEIRRSLGVIFRSGPAVFRPMRVELDG